MPTSHVFLPSPESEAATRSWPANFRHYAGPPFSFRFWDGSVWSSSTDPSTFVISFRTEGAWKQFRSSASDTALAESFITSELDIEGDLYIALRSYRSIRGASGGGAGSMVELGIQALRNLSIHVRTFLDPYQGLTTVSSLIRLERPYRFYRPWLGISMVFSSAYFHTFEEYLDHAQEAGLQRICNKLQLTATDRFLDLNCNSGSLLLHAGAFHETPSHGFTQSNEQLASIELRLVEAGLTSRCAVHHGGYKELQGIRIPFTKVASVGLSEPVLEYQLPEYFRSIYQKLSPRGLFLFEVVTSSTANALDLQFEPGMGFTYRKLPRLSRILDCAERAGFIIANIEELRDHLEATLRLWFRAITRHRHELARMANRRSFRAWELYVACAVESIRAGHISLHQILFRRQLGDTPQRLGSAKLSQEDGDLYPLPDSCDFERDMQATVGRQSGCAQDSALYAVSPLHHARVCIKDSERMADR